MSGTKVLEHGKNFSHASVGSLHDFEGKQFVKEATGATSCEISFGSLPTGASVPFFHSHKENEENYIILSGAGRFQVDNEAFDIAEGSVVRVATGADRNIKCTSAEPLIYVCVQAQQSSLGGYTMTDADITERTSKL